MAKAKKYKPNAIRSTAEKKVDYQFGTLKGNAQHLPVSGTKKRKK